MRALVALLLVAGCLPKPHSDTTRYYVLTADPTTSSAASSLQPLSTPEQPLLGLGPVELPGYLDRSELVSRPESNRLQLAEEDRWGEPLLDGFRRVLRQDLEELLDIDRIVPHPFDVRSPPQLVLAVDVRRFEAAGSAARRAELVARWTLRTGREGRVLARDRTIVHEPIARNGGRGAEVAALSRALSRLAFTLASAVRLARSQQSMSGATRSSGALLGNSSGGMVHAPAIELGAPAGRDAGAVHKSRPLPRRKPRV